MKFTIKNSLLGYIRTILILSLILQITTIFAATIHLINGDYTFENKSDQLEPCPQMMTFSGYNAMMVLNNEKLSDCAYSSTISKKIFTYFMVQRIIMSCFAFFVILQLSLIFRTFPLKIFHTVKNSIRVKYIALIIFIWTITDFIVRFYPSKAIPEYLFYGSYGINTLSHGLLTSLRNINLSLLLVAVLIYLLSIAFEHGTEIQQEADLTI